MLGKRGHTSEHEASLQVCVGREGLWWGPGGDLLLNLCLLSRRRGLVKGR
jgi:hypothetical protein